MTLRLAPQGPDARWSAHWHERPAAAHTAAVSASQRGVITVQDCPAGATTHTAGACTSSPRKMGRVLYSCPDFSFLCLFCPSFIEYWQKEGCLFSSLRVILYIED